MPAPRRLLALTTASGLLVGGLVVVGAAAAEGSATGVCPTYTDPAGDSGLGDPAGVSAEPDVDLLSVSQSVDAGVFTSTLKVAGLTDYGTEYSTGDDFLSKLTVGGKAVVLEATREAPTPLSGLTTTGSLTVGGTASTAKVTAKFDLPTSTVTIGVAVADLEKAVGAPLPGQAVTAMSAESNAYYPSPVGAFPYDDAVAPATAKYAFGGSCSGGAAPVPTTSATPSGSPSPSASPTTSASPSPSTSPAPTASPLPRTDGEPVLYAQPRKGCLQFADAAGDASTNPISDQVGDTDDDLDVINVVYKTTATALQAYVKETALGTGPSSLSSNVYDTHSFSTGFTVGGKAIVVTAGKTGPATATVAGAASTTLHATAAFDTKASNIVFSVPLSELAALTGQAVRGAAVTALTASSAADSSLGAPGGTADTAAPTKDPEKTYVVGDNTCFLPPAGKLYLDDLTGVYTDAAAIAASLQDADGADVAGATLRLALPGQPVRTAVTNSTGDAVFRFPVTSKAGTSTAALSFLGNAEVGAAQLAEPFVVTAESTVLKAAAGKGAVTATLTDNDRAPVAGRVVVFTVGGKTTRVTTNAKGQAVLKGLKKGTAVKASFAAVPGFFTAAKPVTTKAL